MPLTAVAGSPASTAASPRAALAEDRSTSWVADPLADADLDAVAAAVSAGWAAASPPGWARRRTLLVPRPGRAPMEVVDLPVDFLVRLHAACGPLRDPADLVLRPGVCGYRRGAVAGSDYFTEYDRFQELAERPRPDGEVVHADISSFFARVPLARALDSCRRLDADLTKLRAVVAEAERGGWSALPPGYADARLLSNLVLAEAEENLTADFARWVDDYRLFTGTAGPSEAVADLERAVGRVGLRLNPSKTRVVRTATPERAMLSAYQAAAEGGPDGHAALSAMAGYAERDPIARRRELRYALPRLASHLDDRWIGSALRVLRTCPWDAPRAVMYLSAFATDTRVRDGVHALLLSSLSASDWWTAARLLPIAFRTNPPADVLDALEAALPAMGGSVWGLSLRLLASRGADRHRGAAARATEALQVADARSALAARADLDLVLNVPARDGAPATAAWLTEHGQAPLPAVVNWL